jgi:2'-5' RNA ligase
MRRRHRLQRRPALPRRAIVWFPPAEVLRDVEAFRIRHDPLASALPAHVTLVFPFESTLSALQVAAHVRRVVARWPQLPVRIERADALLGEWVNLRMTGGRAAVVELHDRLYRGVLAPFLRRELHYDPHLTVGRANDADACPAMVEAARVALPHAIEATLDMLTVCALGTDGRIVREHTIGLG